MPKKRQIPLKDGRAKSGAGRARTGDLHIRLSAEAIRWLDQLAESQQVNRTVAMERALERDVARICSPDDESTNA